MRVTSIPIIVWVGVNARKVRLRAFGVHSMRGALEGFPLGHELGSFSVRAQGPEGGSVTEVRTGVAKEAKSTDPPRRGGPPERRATLGSPTFGQDGQPLKKVLKKTL